MIRNYISVYRLYERLSKHKSFSLSVVDCNRFQPSVVWTDFSYEITICFVDFSRLNRNDSTIYVYSVIFLVSYCRMWTNNFLPRKSWINAIFRSDQWMNRWNTYSLQICLSVDCIEMSCFIEIFQLRTILDIIMVPFNRSGPIKDLFFFKYLFQNFHDYSANFSLIWVQHSGIGNRKRVIYEHSKSTLRRVWGH